MGETDEVEQADGAEGTGTAGEAAEAGPDLEGRVIFDGTAEGDVLFSEDTLSFLGGVDPETGDVQGDYDVKGDNVAGRVLVFPTGAGSTVGSYIIYRLAKRGKAPAAIVNARADPVIAAGAVMAGIPMVDRVDVGALAGAGRVRVEGRSVRVVE